MHEPWMFTTIQGVTERSTAARSALSHAVIGDDASKPIPFRSDPSSATEEALRVPQLVTEPDTTDTEQELGG